jgi:hypothetical protein
LSRKLLLLIEGEGSAVEDVVLAGTIIVGVMVFTTGAGEPLTGVEEVACENAVAEHPETTKTKLRINMEIINFT